MGIRCSSFLPQIFLWRFSFCISNNKVTDLGLISGKQFFRIRSFKNNKDTFCESFCELGFMPKDIIVPTEECVSGACVSTSAGLFFGIKRYNNDEIILCGYSGDEYRYSRTDKKSERFTLEVSLNQTYYLSGGNYKAIMIHLRCDRHEIVIFYIFFFPIQ